MSFARLPVVFWIQKKSDFEFLKNKFSNYIYHENYNLNKAFNFILKASSNEKASVKDNFYYISALPLRRNFRRFNDYLKIAVINILNKNDGFILHASSIIYKKKGYVFMGKKGAGKSTVRKFLSSFVCLGDDSALVRKVGNNFYLFGSPFYQKTNRTYPSLKVPIAGTFLLKKSNYDLITPLSFSQNFESVLSNTFFSGINDNRIEKNTLFNTCNKFCSQIEGYSLRFKKNHSFWPLVKTALNSQVLKTSTNLVLQKINPRVKKRLPTDLYWYPALASFEFLEKCHIINEISWNFEFCGERRLPKISKLIYSSNFSSNHARLVKKQKKRLLRSKKKPWIVLLEQGLTPIIIDGNHNAVALYQLGKEAKKDVVLKLLIGESPKHEKCAWF